ncbi:4-hydroxybutyrate--acetyl-CoA CoA transferase, partial [Ruminococcaceae bacterium OttesenSCG-928-A11]|nr:4-hydroxybutyrate--acetyl-CoA CoA transferase [Ruminococcaceae bacterium OttesenSCG-928-A11]
MDYQNLYREKLCPAEAIAARIQSGWSCCTDIAACLPAITAALNQRCAAGQLEGVALHGLLDLTPNPLLAGEADGVTPVTWFSGGGLRKAVNAGRGDIMPCFYRDMPSLFTNHVPVDAFLVAVSPMDRHGYFSTGITTSNSAALLEKASRIYLEVNPQMPRSLFGPQIHISRVDALCEYD